MSDIESRLQRLESISERSTSGAKYEPHANAEVPKWLETDSICACEGRPPHRVRDDGFYICSACGGALLPGAIASIENNFTAGEPAESD